MENQPQCIVLTQEDCIKAGALNMEKTIQTVKQALIMHSEKQIIQPLPARISHADRVGDELTCLLAKTGELTQNSPFDDQQTRLIGTSLLMSCDTTSKTNEGPAKKGMIWLFDPQNGMPVALLDGTVIHAMVTGAITSIAISILAKSNACVAGISGSSFQAFTQIRGLLAAMPGIRTVRIFDHDEKRAKHAASTWPSKQNVTFSSVERAEQIHEEADVLITASEGDTPIVIPNRYHEGVLHCDISRSDTPTQALRSMDFVVVDDWEQAKHDRTCKVWQSIRTGLLQEIKLRGNLSDILTSKKFGRQSSFEKIYFNPSGLGVTMLCEAERIYKNARSMGLGQTLDLGLEHTPDPEGIL